MAKGEDVFIKMLGVSQWGAIGICDMIILPCGGTGLVPASLALPHKMPVVFPSHGDDRNSPIHFQKSPKQEEYCLQWETTDPKSSYRKEKQNQNNGEVC